MIIIINKAVHASSSFRPSSGAYKLYEQSAHINKYLSNDARSNERAIRQYTFVA